MHPLFQLHQDIDERVNDIREHHSDWQCRMGCDLCCRRLAEIPSLTRTEWDLLKVGLLTLSPEQLEVVRKKMRALAEQKTRPVVCPLLNESAGACSLYEYRPIACRTYGFYVQRHLGLYCNEIKTEVEQGALADVVWGNHDTIDRRLNALGDTRDLTEWFTELL